MKMKQHKPLTVFLIVATVFLGLTYLPLIGSERILDIFAREDGVFENLTSLYLFLTSVIFAACFFRFRKSAWLLRLSFAGLTLLFFMGAGEEISWGERVFDWDDRNLIRGINVQRELTIHNLKYFQGEDAIIPISTSQAFTAFAFIFAVLIPLASRLSPKIERFIAPFFPVLPLYFGILVAATYIFQKAMVRLLPLFPMLYHHPRMPIPQGVHEIREHGYAFALLASSLFYYLREWAAKKVEDVHETSGILTSPGPVMSVRIDNKGEKI
jgi:hypothetical protein